MSEIELLDSDDGFDLDNDGTPDNGLALLFEDPYIGPALGGDPNEYIAKSIRRAELLLLLDFRNFQGYSERMLRSILISSWVMIQMETKTIILMVKSLR